MARRKTKAKSRSVSVDWSDVELKNYVNREGEYLFKVTGAEEEDEKIIMDAEVISKVQNGRTMKTYFNLQPQSLWVLAQFLEAVGIDTPDSEEDLDLDSLTDLEFVGRVEEQEYDDKKYMRIRAFNSAEDFEGERGGSSKKKSKKDGDEGEDGDKPSKRGGKKSKKKVAQSEIQDMDQDELEEFISEHELDVDLDDHKTLRKMRVAVIDAAEKAGILEDDD